VIPLLSHNASQALLGSFALSDALRRGGGRQCLSDLTDWSSATICYAARSSVRLEDETGR
jgi:hypothetical protein